MINVGHNCQSRSRIGRPKFPLKTKQHFLNSRQNKGSSRVVGLFPTRRSSLSLTSLLSCDCTLRTNDPNFKAASPPIWHLLLLRYLSGDYQPFASSASSTMSKKIHQHHLWSHLLLLSLRRRRRRMQSKSNNNTAFRAFEFTKDSCCCRCCCTIWWCWSVRVSTICVTPHFFVLYWLKTWIFFIIDPPPPPPKPSNYYTADQKINRSLLSTFNVLFKLWRWRRRRRDPQKRCYTTVLLVVTFGPADAAVGGEEEVKWSEKKSSMMKKGGQCYITAVKKLLWVRVNCCSIRILNCIFLQLKGRVTTLGPL